MKNLILYLVLLPLLGLAKTNRATSSDAQLNTGYKPRNVYGNNFLGVELLGRGGLYALYYDRAITSRLSVGSGLSYYQVNLVGINFDIAIVPIYLNYYFSGPVHRAFITGGASVSYVKAEVFDAYYLNTELPRHDIELVDNYSMVRETSVSPSVGIGYEYRSRPGFTFRGVTYIHAFNNRVFRWYGATLGTHF